jgi:hypothetical protein
MKAITLAKRIIPSSIKRTLKELLKESTGLESSRLVGMTTTAEQEWYSKIAEELSFRDGAVVDLGSWMGSTAISLARGVRNAARPNDPTKSVYAIDRYIWESWMNPYMARLSCDYLPGDSFLPEVRHRFSLSKERILPIQADLTEYSWKGGPIIILLVDAMKNFVLCRTIAAEFYPHLVEGSIVIHQDFKHYYAPCIHVLQYRLKDFFSFFHNVHASGTVAFKVERIVPPSIIEEATQMSDIPDQEIADAISYSMNLVDESGKPNIAAAHVMHFLHGNRIEKALEVLDFYRATYGSMGDLAHVCRRITERVQNPPICPSSSR